ncbi:MAG: nicotinamide riboside transporter PnuC [Saprospiraceae bacterium]|nr:nicotinamide riboside transporter PnuC [Saprospiraceae bacterium]MCF8249476.1 nicotinamide riboside transporter PnuC [Saprospiraceae bacterium]MCF8283159.1 nicotinamide riboside transporter PnuC [Bacteroidales bacterium]MCF8310694.1 nicotinamide riboside transporter PnuC [Saprospiraceae bacterium]MCF8439475.1 nicotinamide riboside transporter PnuC [Saprospiraceae bacterium]
MELSQLFTVFAEQIKSQNPLDWAITFTALLYVWLAARESAWCWVSGIVSSGLWAWADFARYNLWVDGLLQVFYVLMGFVGLYAWLFAKQEGEDKMPIRRLPLNLHLKLWVAGVVLTLILGFLFQKYTATSFPYADSFITAFSIIATFLTIKKVLENWLYWIVFDTLAIFLFWAKDATLVAMVMVVYAAMAVYGFQKWKKEIVH